MVVAIKHSSKLDPQSLQVNDQRVVGTPMAGGSSTPAFLFVHVCVWLIHGGVTLTDTMWIVYKSVVVKIVLVVGSW